MTAKELAKMLNISPATVSIVLNGKPGISEETRRKVLLAAEEMGYSFKKPTTSRKNQITYIIYKKSGRVVADTPFFEKVTEGVTTACQVNGCVLQIIYFYQEEDIASQMAYLKKLSSDGIVLLGTELTKDDFIPFSQLGIPLVVLDCNFDDVPVDTVVINNLQGAFRATSHLIEAGCKEVGYLKSSERIQNFKERADGYYKALRRHNFEIDHEHIHTVAPVAEEAYLDMKKMLECGVRPASAYFADNDIIAVACIRAFQEYGYRIPEDISIVGFDDVPACRYMNPQLTTMCVEKQKLGELAVNRLVEKMKYQDATSVTISLYTELVERESVRV